MEKPIRNKREQLWLAIRLPLLPLEVLGQPIVDAPVVVVEKHRVDLVVCANDAATANGVGIGMDSVRAQVLSDCDVKRRDVALERQKLTALADGLYRFSPYIEIYECAAIAQAAVRLEVSTCLSLFGDLQNLLGQAHRFMSSTGFSFEIGIAHTADAAWLLSWSERKGAGGQRRKEFIAQLKPLPISLLHDYPAAVAMLQKTGFITLGDVARQIEARSIAGLKKRLSHDFIEYVAGVFDIDGILQQKALFQKPVVQYRPHEIYREEIPFEYPIADAALLHAPIEGALQNLSDHLRRRQLECQQINWILRDIHKRSDEMIVSADSGQSDWRLLYDLTLIQLENRSLSFEVDCLELLCSETTPLQNRGQALAFTQSRSRKFEQELEIVIAKLKARLGERAVYKLSYCDSHTPEAMAETVPVNVSCNQSLPPELATAQRPFWLFSEPYRAEMRERGVYWRGYFRLLVGPERIHDDWWQSPRARDYYLAQRDDNGRFWIFQDVYDGSWHVHGVFA